MKKNGWFSSPTQVYWTCAALLEGREISRAGPVSLDWGCSYRSNAERGEASLLPRLRAWEYRWKAGAENRHAGNRGLCHCPRLCIGRWGLCLAEWLSDAGNPFPASRGLPIAPAGRSAARAIATQLYD